MASKTADFQKKLQDFKARLKTEAPAPPKKKAKKKRKEERCQDGSTRKWN